MHKFYILRDLSVLFFANPLIAIKQLSLSNIRRLLASISRHDRGTVVAIVQNKLRRESELTCIQHADDSTAPRLRKLRELEERYPGITEPVGLHSIYILEEKLASPDFEIDSAAPRRVNFLLPQLDPLIMFGGYISCLQFIRKVQDRGFKVRILLCESGPFNREAVDAKLATNPPLQQAIAASEVENISLRSDKVVISPSDAFVCYSYWTGIKAHQMAQAIGKEFIFFLQEFESIFHPHDSCHAIAGHVYRLPHRAIFNTTLLADYFRSKQLGVFSLYQGHELTQHYVAYQHALTPTSPPSLDELANRRTKRFLFYGRPEGHARRNLFEIAVIGLKIAIRQGVFDDSWEFIGVGTLGTEHHIDLGYERTMKLTGTLPQCDYADALRGFDLGLSLMLAPHPSILPFEMASAGQIVVTNSFESRTADVLRAISNNIEPCEAYPQSVAESLAKAVERVTQHEDRIKGASFNWVRDWNDAFNDEVMEQISRMLLA
jgi:hypothetical protein